MFNEFLPPLISNKASQLASEPFSGCLQKRWPGPFAGIQLANNRNSGVLCFSQVIFAAAPDAFEASHGEAQSLCMDTVRPSLRGVLTVCILPSGCRLASKSDGNVRRQAAWKPWVPFSGICVLMALATSGNSLRASHTPAVLAASLHADR